MQPTIEKLYEGENLRQIPLIRKGCNLCFRKIIPRNIRFKQYKAPVWLLLDTNRIWGKRNKLLNRLC